MSLSLSHHLTGSSLNIERILKENNGPEKKRETQNDDESSKRTYLAFSITSLSHSTFLCVLSLREEEKNQNLPASQSLCFE